MVRAFFANSNWFIAFHKIIHCVRSRCWRYGFCLNDISSGILRILVLLADFSLAWVVLTHEFIDSPEWSIWWRFIFSRYNWWIIVIHHKFSLGLVLFILLLLLHFIQPSRFIATELIIGFLESSFSFHYALWHIFCLDKWISFWIDLIPLCISLQLW